MSLVNNMLRDLDQRRKESDGAAKSVSLMPASEIPIENKQRMVMTVVAGLLLASLGLAYFWMQLSGQNDTQQLDIRPQVSVSTLDAENSAEQSPVIDTFNDSNTATQPAPENLDLAAVSEAPAVVLRQEQDISVTESQPDSVSVDNESLASVVPSIDEDGRQSIISEPAEPEQTAAQLVQESVINQPPPESIKDAAVVSSEQQDTMAVQKALGQIANNQFDLAYLSLEEQINANRYAHQSRETYAKLLLSQGRVQEAFSLVESGLTLAPNHPGFKKVKARLFIDNGEIDNAVNLLLSRAPEVSNDLEYHEILATAQLASRDYEGASISYRGLVQQDRSQGNWWYGFARSQDSMGNVPAARQAYSQALQLPSLSAGLRRRSQERLAVLSQ